MIVLIPGPSCSLDCRHHIILPRWHDHWYSLHIFMPSDSLLSYLESIYLWLLRCPLNVSLLLIHLSILTVTELNFIYSKFLLSNRLGFLLNLFKMHHHTLDLIAPFSLHISHHVSPFTDTFLLHTLPFSLCFWYLYFLIGNPFRMSHEPLEY